MNMDRELVPLVWFVMEAQTRAAIKGIELFSNQDNLVYRFTPRGHYLALSWGDKLRAQITAIDAYQPTPGTYEGLLPGFVLSEIVTLGVPECPEEVGRYIGIVYEFNEELFERTVMEPWREEYIVK